MNAIEFLPFMGHSSIHPPFDDFLMDNGITWRPKIGRNLDTSFFIPGTGLNLTFDFGSSAPEDGFAVKSEGSFVFNEFAVTFIAEDKKNGQYKGPLPHGLVASDTRQTVEQKLGTPKRRNEGGDNYYLDGLVWVVAFEEQKLEFIQFYLPTDNKRKYGLCP